MGIVARQTAINSVLTYLGFALGGINTVFLYTRFMSETYFGLVGVILSTGALLMPLMSLGIPNTLVRFFSRFEDRRDQGGFLSLMLFLPLLAVVPLGIFSWAANSLIGNFLSRENPVVAGYVWHIFLIGMGMAYFEVFFAWSKIRLRSAVGTFMKEVFVRLGVMLLLLLLAFDRLDTLLFLDLLVGLYLLRMVAMAVYALNLQPLRLSNPVVPGAEEPEAGAVSPPQERASPPAGPSRRCAPRCRTAARRAARAVRGSR